MRNNFNSICVKLPPTVMAWNFKALPKEVQSMVNSYRFDGTPSAKAMKAFDINIIPIPVSDDRPQAIEIIPLFRTAFRYVYVEHDIECPVCHPLLYTNYISFSICFICQL